MSVNSKMKKICDNIRLRTGGTALLNLDQIAEAIMLIGEATDPATTVYRTIGATYPPDQLPADPAFTGYDIDILNATADGVYTYIDNAVSGKDSVVKEIMGKDASETYNVARYIYANREHYAWQRENYPKMYAWKNDATVKYTESVSPRIGEMAYDVPYVKTSITQTETVPPKAVIIRGYRYSHSGAKFSAQASCAALVWPVGEMTYDYAASVGSTHTLELTNATFHTSYDGFYIGETSTAFPGNPGGVTKDSTTKRTIKCMGTAFAGKRYGVIFLAWDNSSTMENVTVTINGVKADVIVTTNTADASKAAYSTTTQVEVEGDGGTPISAVSATRRSRTIGGVEFVRYEDGDVDPTTIYTDKGDSRNSGTTITQDGIIYTRYPLGDLGANRQKLIPVFIYANEHGIVADPSSTKNYETKMCALVAARFLRDLASDNQLENPLYKFIRENCAVIVIPVASPFGFNLNLTGGSGNNTDSGYVNVNRCNINRNYDCPGWDVMNPNGSITEFGAYPGSENETQYIMNTMAESSAAVAMSLHGLGGWEGYCAHQGQNPGGVDYNRNKLAKVNDFLYSNYGYRLRYYELTSSGEPLPCQNTPDITSKSPSYITQCGAYGGIVEFQPDDVKVSGFVHEMKSSVIEHAYAQMLNLTAMWLSDYLEAR